MDRHMNLTEDELLEAIKKAAEKDDEGDGAFTTTEIREMLGWRSTRYFDEKVRRFLRPLVKSGKVEVTHKRMMTIAGWHKMESAYRWVNDDA